MYDPGSPLLRSSTPSKNLPEPPARARFAEDRLLAAVVSCDVAPGETVTEAIVMERFGLKRAAARAALARLGYDGWARPLARTGWEVLPVTGSLIGQVLEARRVAEPAALSRITPDLARSERLETLGNMTDALCRQADPAARATLDRTLADVDTLLLEATESFTARHLRLLWQHTARIARHLAVEDAIAAVRRAQAPAFVAALLAGDGAAVASARLALIDMQQELFLREILQNEAALGPGSGSRRHQTTRTAAHNGRTI